MQPEEQPTPTGHTVKLQDYLALDERDRMSFVEFFCYYSNLIEGIRVSPIQTMSVDEKPQPTPELDGHYNAFNYMLANYPKPLGEQEIKQMHSFLMKDLMKKSEQIGNYRTCNVYIGNDSGVVYQSVPELMKELAEKIKVLEKKDSGYQRIWNIHNEFEIIHPFVDGNGRTGRLILNWLSLKHLGQFEIIEIDKREVYYQAIKDYRIRFKDTNPRVEFSPTRQQDIFMQLCLQDLHSRESRSKKSKHQKN